MPLNDAYGPQSAARPVYLRVLMNGQIMPGVISADVTQNSFYHAATFRLEVAVNAGPVGWWDVEPPMLIEVQVATYEPGWTTLVVGEADHLLLSQQTGTLSVEGRDLTARFIEAKTQETFKNQTASQVAETLAARHELSAVVTPTTTLVGRYYQQDHDRLSLDQFSRVQNEWDLLVFLAQQEGFDVFVMGTTLYFQPATPPNADPFVIAWQQPNPTIPILNVSGLNMSRSLTLAKDIEVWVRSWNSRSKSGFTKIIRGSGTRKASASGTTGKVAGKTNTQRYVFVRPNLTQDQALKFGQQMLEQLTRHERVVEVTMPGEPNMSPRNMVRIEGTGTSFDQTYWVDSIERSVSFAGGFQQHMRLKNHSPQSEVQVQ